MKTIRNFNLLMGGLMVAASALVLSSCDGEEEPPAKPTASFTYEAEGREVAFTSTSANAKTYSWDFGDGETSTDENPTHTYEAYGEYTVKLSVTGDGGNATSLPDQLTLAKSSSVDIDGVFTDWAEVATLTTFSATGNDDLPSMTELKMDYDANNIYFYVKGTADMKGFFDIYFNADNDTLTGYASGTYLMYGAEYLYEGDLGADIDASLLGFDGATQAAFSYGVEAAAAGSGFLQNSGVVATGSAKEIEFAFSRASFTDLSDEKIGVAIMDWKDPANGEWFYIGSLPGAYVGNPLVYLDLTK